MDVPNWVVLLVNAGGVFVLMAYVHGIFNGLRDYIDEKVDKLATDLRGEIRDLRGVVHGLDIRVARLEGKSEAEVKAEEEAVKIAAE